MKNSGNENDELEYKLCYHDDFLGFPLLKSFLISIGSHLDQFETLNVHLVL